MMQTYSQDCDYLREKFGLPPETNLYELVRKLTEYVVQNEEKQELGKLKEEISQGEEECQTQKPKSTKKKSTKKIQLKLKKKS